MYNITTRDKTEINVHNNTPCIKGLIPIDFNASFERPAPIKNNVRVSPRFETVTMDGLRVSI